MSWSNKIHEVKCFFFLFFRVDGLRYSGFSQALFKLDPVFLDSQKEKYPILEGPAHSKS